MSSSTGSMPGKDAGSGSRPPLPRRGTSPSVDRVKAAGSLGASQPEDTTDGALAPAPVHAPRDSAQNVPGRAPGAAGPDVTNPSHAPGPVPRLSVDTSWADAPLPATGRGGEGLSAIGLGNRQHRGDPGGTGRTPERPSAPDTAADTPPRKRHGRGLLVSAAVVGVAVAGVAAVRMNDGPAHPESDTAGFRLVESSPLEDLTPEGPPPSSTGRPSGSATPSTSVSPSLSPTTGRPSDPATPTAGHTAESGHPPVQQRPDDTPPSHTVVDPAPLTVSATRVLNRGQSIVNGPTALTMDSGGNLVVTHNGAVTWSSGTTGRGVSTVFQDDGNFVVYAADNSTAWSTRTDGHNGAALVITGSGEMYISYQGMKLWHT